VPGFSDSFRRPCAGVFICVGCTDFGQVKFFLVDQIDAASQQGLSTGLLTIPVGNSIDAACGSVKEQMWFLDPRLRISVLN
jgi:hypothetical protein